MNPRMHKDSEQSSDCMIIDMVRGVRKAAAYSEGWEPWDAGAGNKSGRPHVIKTKRPEPLRDP